MPQHSVTITGNVVNVPQFVHTQNSHRVLKMRVASSRNRWVESEGWKSVDQLFVDVDVWDDMADNVFRSVKKGDSVIVVGTLVTNSWETKEGEKRSKIAIRAGHVGLDLGRAICVKLDRTQRGLDLSEPEIARRLDEVLGDIEEELKRSGSAQASEQEKQELEPVGQ